MRTFLVAATLSALIAGSAAAATADSTSALGALVGARAGAAIGAFAEVAAPATPTAATTAPAKPLAGRTIVVDPGHQLGNSRFPREINKLVDAGNGQRKACNTTGTATDAGYPEATFAWQVASRVRSQLEALGATVIMTRDANSTSLWGPCIDVRGKIGSAGYDGQKNRASLKLSIHGDGSAAGNRGFHLILVGGSGVLHRKSLAYAEATRTTLQAAGFARSTYIGNGTALSVRDDLGTLNLSTMPAVMAELGNMRNAAEARVMSTSAGQQQYSRALIKGVKSYFDVA